MESTSMPLIVDLIIIGLLIGTIIHSMSLSKSLQSFKILHSEMMPMMREHGKNLNTSLHQMDHMKKISREIDHIINSRVPAALKIKQDLDFLVSRANELADHLESMIQSGRDIEFSSLKKGHISPQSSQLKIEVPQEEIISKSTSPKKRRTNKTKESFTKPFVESFFLTKTAKKLFHKKSLNTEDKMITPAKDEKDIHHAA